MAEIKGIVKSSEQLKSTINTNVRLKGLVSVGGVLIGAQLGKRGVKGDKGDTGDKGDSGTTDYNDLINKPSIEGVTLIGNKTFEELTLVNLSNEELEVLLY